MTNIQISDEIRGKLNWLKNTYHMESHDEVIRYLLKINEQYHKGKMVRLIE